MRIKLRAALLALFLPAMVRAGDTLPQERTVKASFSPAITPTLTGSPGPNVYLRTMGSGPPIWAPVPPAGSVIPSGSGYVKQGPAGTFTNVALIPVGDYAPPGAALVSYSPAVPGTWPIVPTQVGAALDALAAYVTSTNATATARAAPLYWSVGNTGSIATNNYLGRLGDISATATSVAPAVVPCNGTIGDLRAQRTANATATGTIQIFKATGGGVPTYASTGLTCAITVGTASCSQVLSTAVSAGDLLIVRAVGSAWSVGAGTISVKLLCS